jgi:hypothetical protein
MPTQLYGDCLEAVEVEPVCPQVLSPPPSAPPPSRGQPPKGFPFCVCDRAIGSLPFSLSDVVEQPDEGLGLRTYCFQVRAHAAPRGGVNAVMPQPACMTGVPAGQPPSVIYHRHMALRGCGFWPLCCTPYNSI